MAGEGSGHAMRSRVIIEHLQKKHTVKVVSHDFGYKNLQNDFDMTEIAGLRFVYRHNKVQYIETALHNLLKLGSASKSVNRVLKLITKFKPDYIITDFEPVTAFLAKLKGIPLISIDNQHFITNTRISFPRKYQKDYLAAKAVINLVIPPAKAYLVTTIAQAPIVKKKTFLFPPILRPEVLKLKPSSKDYILVYTTSRFGELNKILKKIDQKFIVYGMNKFGKEKNIIYKKPSQTGFLRDLADCKAVISTSGFTLLGESLHLNKPFCALPVERQFEQIINAIYVEKQGYGYFCKTVDYNEITGFIKKIPDYKKALEKYNRSDNKKLFRKIDLLIK